MAPLMPQFRLDCYNIQPKKKIINVKGFSASYERNYPVIKVLEHLATVFALEHFLKWCEVVADYSMRLRKLELGKCPKLSPI